MKVFEILLTLPFRVIFAILSFIVWDLLSNGEWEKRKRLVGCPVGYWQEQAQWATSQQKLLEYEHQKQLDDLHAAYQREIDKKDRKISRLRSS